MAIGIIHGQRSGVQTINNQPANEQGNYNVTPGGIGALPTSGGTMNGPLVVKTPTANNQAVNLEKAKSLVNGAWKTVKGTLTRNGWSGRWQTINCPGLTANSRVIASADGNNTAGTRAWKDSDVWAAQQEAGKVKFYYYEDAPESDIPVIIFYEVGA